MGASPEKLRARAAELHEFNPMLGFRGCRLAIAYPEIAEMQARAIFEAALEAARTTGAAGGAGDHGAAGRHQARARPRQGPHRRHGRGGDEGGRAGHLLPDRHDDRTAARRHARRRDRRERRVLLLRHQRPDPDDLRHQPRRCRRLPRHLCRRRASSPRSVRLDRPGGRRRARPDRRASAGRATRPDIKLGICGEHGGDPASIGFCEKAGLDYVSCSPFRVPIARLAAAQAALKGH